LWYFTLQKTGHAKVRLLFIEVIENLSLDINYGPIEYICGK